uniref:One cut domain family member n=2 Tax=Clytia hemisphaerica TaxID=252671 RepID=A0A7M6DP88_9CNID
NEVIEFLKSKSIDYVVVEECDPVPDDMNETSTSSPKEIPENTEAQDHQDNEDSVEESDEEEMVNVQDVSKKVEAWLAKSGVSKTFFAESILKKRQSTLCDLLKKKKIPKSSQGWLPWIRMKEFLESTKEKSDLITAFKNREVKEKLDFRKSAKPYKFSKVQIALLDKYYQNKRGILDEDTKEALSKIADIPAKNAVIWFQNARKRQRDGEYTPGEHQAKIQKKL